MQRTRVRGQQDFKRAPSPPSEPALLFFFTVFAHQVSTGFLTAAAHYCWLPPHIVRAAHLSRLSDMAFEPVAARPGASEACAVADFTAELL